MDVYAQLFKYATPLSEEYDALKAITTEPNLISILDGMSDIVTQEKRRFTFAAGEGSVCSPMSGGSHPVAIISPAVVSALILRLAMEKGGVGIGGVGKRNFNIVAERQVSDTLTEIGIYSPSEGSFFAATYDADTMVIDPYSLDPSNEKDCALLFLVFLQAALDDSANDEIREQYDNLKTMAFSGFKDRDAVLKTVAIISQNLYYNLKDDAVDSHLEFKLPKSGSLPAPKAPMIAKDMYAPDSVICGEFRVLGNTAPSTSTSGKKTKKVKTTAEDVQGKYETEAREFSDEEKALIPTIKPSYIIPAFLIDTAKTVKDTYGTPYPMTNFAYRGSAGTGKSSACEALAAALNRPYVFFTCSSDTEIFDFVGQVMPSQNKTSPEAMRLMSKFDKLGGINSKNIAKVFGLPSLEDAEFMPEETYKELTGKDLDESLDDMGKLSATYAAWHDKMESIFDEIVELLSTDNDNHFVYTETSFIKAIKNGYVCEIQEPNVIASPGVMVGLNGLLEEGSITLPTGEVVKRHPDTVIVLTTNGDYQGCRAMNQAVLDRCDAVYDVETPDVSVMAERAMAITGFEDEAVVTEMAEIVKDIAANMVNEGVDDGTCGMRSLLSWVMKTKITGDPYTSAKSTVIAKTSGDREVREALEKRLDESSFYPKRKRTRRR